MGGVYFSRGAPTISLLAKIIEKELNECKHSNLFLDGDILIQSREQAELELKLKSRKKTKIIPGNPLTAMYEDPRNQWFAFFHVHT